MEGKNKKDKLLISCIAITIILVVCIIAGVSYAYWSYTATQGTSNKITSDCLKVSIEDVTEAIDLQKAYPITDEEAADLTPYTFKITNTCSYTESYTVNLEVMDVASRLSSDYVAISFNGGSKSILSSLTETTPTYKKDDYTAIEAYNLTSGKLDGGASTTYTISLWMDESVTVEDDAMNKNFVSKISVTAEIYNPKLLCRRAKTLHTETCTNTGTTSGCQKAGYALNDTIVYGNETVTAGTLTTGDAFDCDVNGDGKYDAETERFYYVSDYYDASINELYSGYVTLVYYTNVSGGIPDNISTYIYDSSELTGPATAVKQLPTKSQWSKGGLYTSYREIEAIDNGSYVAEFDYSRYGARFLMNKEIEAGCGSTSNLNNKCEFLLENTKYANSNSIDSYWLEEYSGSSSSWPMVVEADYYTTSSAPYDVYYGVRPAIDVSINNITY